VWEAAVFTNFWSYAGWIFATFVMVAVIFVVCFLLLDVFRDRELGVGWKVLWTILLIALPFIGSLAYIIARGKGIADRTAARENANRPPAEDDSYRPQVSSSPAEDIAHAKELLEAGTINEREYEVIKNKALTGRY
jgi:hypothetical protein